MAYCPKCGVEVDNHVKECPLCDFPIPDVTGENDEENQTEKRYPLAVNTYPQDHNERKNQVFYSLELIFVTVLLITIVLRVFFSLNNNIVRTIMVIDLAIVFLLLFCFNYLPGWLNISGCYLTVLAMCFGLSKMIGGSGTWFYDYLIPIATLVFVLTAMIWIIFRRNRHRNQFIFIPTMVMLYVVLLCLGIDGIITTNIFGEIHLTWSLIVAVSGICLVAIMQGIYHGVPDKTKEYLKKKLRI